MKVGSEPDSLILSGSVGEARSRILESLSRKKGVKILHSEEAGPIEVSMGYYVRVRVYTNQENGRTRSRFEYDFWRLLVSLFVYIVGLSVGIAVVVFGPSQAGLAILLVFSLLPLLPFIMAFAKWRFRKLMRTSLG